MTADRALALLRHAPIFQGAQPADLQPLAELGHFSSLSRGEHLFHAGQAVESLYVVALGSVRVYRLSRGGRRELTLHVEGPRQVVAGVAAFQSRAVYPAQAQALQTPTEVLGLPVDAVRQAVFQTPALAQAVIAYFARRQAELLGRLDSLVFSELGERLAAYLLEHAAAPHALPTNSELAALLGTVPELISRKLGEFYRLGLIVLERRTVQVCDAAELSRLAGGRQEEAGR
ncbi:Crp/Fnr family transcriptional regulator [Deinococcus radiopugnans]|uniref:CRP/FNR family transcriptional regulator n=1 Tax=Deinococcus radiopugnans ATCC 19172 TaxID=585398 RepID=A0A5C4Y968_9DEIO|nr:Crp/Fnr family transcriptional regulator [Deinococcus radiopugnans]MBB6016034.1 CRP/FNR family transcriptional regulator [Deinococcus radiopugnans ATCC 19172]TNM72070.1 Crp/Fnr family transcriptional regulator [Deinococcus radiopugnans ATCC 19172]